MPGNVRSVAPALPGVADRSLQDELAHAQRLATTGIMAASVAHEINNLLTPAMAYVQMAASSPGDNEIGRKAIDHCARSLRQIQQLVSNVLHFAQPGSSHGTCDVAQVINAAIDVLHRSPAKSRIKIVNSVAPGTAVRIEPLYLQQVMVNLMLNAMRAMGKSGGEIRIEASSAANQQVRITVADTGPGISDDIAGRLFVPFASNSRKALAANAEAAECSEINDDSGVGLGLSICKRLVESAGGSISLISTGGAGATFEILLQDSREIASKAG